MKLKANMLSLIFKIIGCAMILIAIVLNGFEIWSISIAEIITGVMAIQALVLPIDISKIKSSAMSQSNANSDLNSTSNTELEIQSNSEGQE